jgi:hypothetical protein
MCRQSLALINEPTLAPMTFAAHPEATRQRAARLRPRARPVRRLAPLPPRPSVRRCVSPHAYCTLAQPVCACWRRSFPRRCPLSVPSMAGQHSHRPMTAGAQSRPARVASTPCRAPAAAPRLRRPQRPHRPPGRRRSMAPGPARASPDAPSTKRMGGRVLLNKFLECRVATPRDGMGHRPPLAAAPRRSTPAQQRRRDAARAEAAVAPSVELIHDAQACARAPALRLPWCPAHASLSSNCR